MIDYHFWFKMALCFTPHNVSGQELVPLDLGSTTATDLWAISFVYHLQYLIPF